MESFPRGATAVCRPGFLSVFWTERGGPLTVSPNCSFKDGAEDRRVKKLSMSQMNSSLLTRSHTIHRHALPCFTFSSPPPSQLKHKPQSAHVVLPNVRRWLQLGSSVSMSLCATSHQPGSPPALNICCGNVFLSAAGGRRFAAWAPVGRCVRRDFSQAMLLAVGAAQLAGGAGRVAAG